MPFTPWIEHPLVEGVCRACGLTPHPYQVSTVTPNTAYTHQESFLTTKPLGNIVQCKG